MDAKALQDAIEEVIDLLPGEIPLVLAQMVPKYWEPISAAAPRLKEIMMPHIMSGISERAMGVLDINDVKTAIEGAFMAKIPVLAEAMARLQAAQTLPNIPQNPPHE